MNNNSNIFEELKAWPVRFLMPSKTGYTFWGQSHEDAEDVLLHFKEHIILFKSLGSLLRFVSNDGKKYLTEFRKHEKFYLLNKNDPFISESIEEACEELNFILTKNILCGGLNHFENLEDCHTVLNCLNMLYDIGITLKNDMIVYRLEAGKSEVALLMDALTFIKESELRSSLGAFDFLVISEIYTKLLKIAEEKTLLYG